MKANIPDEWINGETFMQVHGIMFCARKKCAIRYRGRLSVHYQVKDVFLKGYVPYGSATGQSGNGRTMETLRCQWSPGLQAGEEE